MNTNPANNIVLLLTGTVNVNNKHFTLLTNGVKRKQEYVDTITYYLQHYNFPVVFVENSNEDLSGNFSSEFANRLEVLSFDGNNYPPEMGKGLGEMKCIEYAITHSGIIRDTSFIFKITGRYRILNLPDFIDTYTKKPSLELLADLTNNFRFSSSAIVGFRPFFAKRWLFKNADLLNDEKGFYFEHALAKAVLEAIGERITFRIFKHYPIIKAISGTTGKPYNKSFFYMLPRKLKYWIRYYIVIR